MVHALIPTAAAFVFAFSGQMPLHYAQAQAQAQAQADVSVSTEDTGDNIFEVTISGRDLPSRDAVEGRLLRETAQLTLRSGHEWFALLPMPGELDSQSPPRSVPAYGARYAGWHPQWIYRLKGEGWHAWRPEWRSTFWADSVDINRIAAFEVSAFVLIGSGQPPEDREPIDARAVLKEVNL